MSAYMMIISILFFKINSCKYRRFIPLVAPLRVRVRFGMRGLFAPLEVRGGSPFLVANEALC